MSNDTNELGNAGLTCLFCGYDLRGLPDTTCPECGRFTDPNPPVQSQTDRKVGWTAAGVGVIVSAAIVLGCCLLAERNLRYAWGRNLEEITRTQGLLGTMVFALFLPAIAWSVSAKVGYGYRVARTAACAATGV